MSGSRLTQTSNSTSSTFASNNSSIPYSNSSIRSKNSVKSNRGNKHLQTQKDPRLAGPQSKKFKFTKTEDTKLLSLVHLYGENDWRSVADQMPYRTARQCRERWTNYVNPDLNKKPWSIPEDMCLMLKHQEFGNKWKIIQKFFPGRSKNDIKQRIKHIETEQPGLSYYTAFNHSYDHAKEKYENYNTNNKILVPNNNNANPLNTNNVQIFNNPINSPINNGVVFICPENIEKYETVELNNYFHLEVESPPPSCDPRHLSGPMFPYCTSNSLIDSHETNHINDKKSILPEQKLFLMDVQELWPSALQLPMLENR
ncbi:hypothetical protein TRFO_11766 [Tritrichomonas foetus]|uniref:Myb-like DNA-binding domain containing protein n=1 Tax=Tritrichomonas foetus TaxID=1144522 RepID=A0A1J4J7B7_9EUKA|nr:hypothetical protein TRFO_11766 [Tritrichomonas foetus]|eukprot:OHS93547.1 hypothetical protein TRFO_11766 [Tritrichomonas foetus]